MVNFASKFSKANNSILNLEWAIQPPSNSINVIPLKVTVKIVMD